MKRILLSLTEQLEGDLRSLAEELTKSTGLRVTTQQAARIAIAEKVKKDGIR